MTSSGEGSLREIWTALSLVSRRLDELAGAVTRLPPAGEAPEPAGAPLDETARAGLRGLQGLLAVGPGLALPDALALAVDRAVHRAGADCAAVLLLTPDGRVEAVAHRGFGAEVPLAARDRGIVGLALRDGEIVAGESEDRARDALMREHALVRALALPLRVAPAPAVGVLLAGRRRDVAFAPPDLRVLVLLGDRLGWLLGRAGPSVAAAPAALAADLDVGRAAETVAREAAALLGAPAVAVLLPDGAGLRVEAGTGISAAGTVEDARVGVLAAVLRSRTLWTAGEGREDDALARLLGATPRLVVPLLSRGGALVALLAAGGPRPLSPAALAPLLSPAATALRNARLHAETVAALAELRAGEDHPPIVEPPPPARDFAGLLAVILGRVTAVRDRMTDPALRRELDVAEEAAWRAAEAVRGLLGFAPGHRGEPLTPLDVGPVLRQAVDRARARWTSREASPPTLRLDLEALPPIRGSVASLAEALDHLLENAAEASQPGGAITVRGRWDGGPRVEITVEDRGAGMDEATRARALDAFFSTRGVGRLGLGLCVAQAIVTRHRGELDLASAPGRGTTVRVTLSTVAGERRSSGDAAAGAVAARVLVVEPDAAVRETLVDVLTQQGHLAFTAAEGAEGLDLVRRESIDLVLADLTLPGMGGLELARAVKRARPGVPVLLLTGWPGDLDRDRVADSGVDGVIEKPVGLVEVRTAVAAALAQRAAPRP